LLLSTQIITADIKRFGRKDEKIQRQKSTMKINPPQKADVRKSSLYGWLPTWEKATVGCRVQANL